LSYKLRLVEDQWCPRPTSGSALATTDLWLCSEVQRNENFTTDLQQSNPAGSKQLSLKNQNLSLKNQN
jgi:hypothetical protein